MASVCKLCLAEKKEEHVFKSRVEYAAHQKDNHTAAPAVKPKAKRARKAKAATAPAPATVPAVEEKANDTQSS